MNQGIYEELITQLVSKNLNKLDKDKFYLKKTIIDKEEASNVLSKHLAQTLKHAFQLVKGKTELQIEIANKIIRLLKDELNKQEFDDDLVNVEGEILKAVFFVVKKGMNFFFSTPAKTFFSLSVYTTPFPLLNSSSVKKPATPLVIFSTIRSSTKHS